MVNILYLTGTNPLKDGGVNQAVKASAAALQKQKQPVHLLFGYGPDGYLNNLPKLLRKLDLGLGSRLLKRYLKKILAEQKIDIIHAHGSDAIYDLAGLRRWLKNKNIKLIGTLHGLDREVLDQLKIELKNKVLKLSLRHLFHLFYFSLAVLKERFAYKNMDRLIAVSPGIKENLFNFYQLHAMLVPNGLSPQAKPKTFAESLTREKLGLKKNDKVILFIGVSAWIKGYFYLQKIMQKKYKYIIVGCPLPEKKENLINLPYLPNAQLRSLYKLADVLVHPGITEAFGITYLEALANGLPIVTFQTHGSDYFLRDQENALIVPSRDTKKLAQTVDKLLSSSALRRQLIKQGLLTVDQFSYTKTAAALLPVYQNILKQKTILLIPHLVKNNIRSRTEEMAKAFAQSGEKVYLLYWRERKEKKYGFSFRNIFYLFSEFFRLPTFKTWQGLQLIYLPRLVYPLKLATIFNSWLINLFLRNSQVNFLINAAFLYYRLEPGSFTYLYDLVDDHVEYTKNNLRPGSDAVATQMAKYIEGEMAKADKVLFVTKKLAQKYPVKNYTVLPNGAFFREYTFDQKILKDKYDLKNKFIYGLIGNHGEWSGIAEMLTIFVRYAKELHGSVLLIAGRISQPGLVKNLPDNILYLGEIAKEKVNELYSLIDVGLQTAEDSPFRQATYPLKVIEYTAAKKIVLALQAKNLAEIKLPNLVVSGRGEKEILKNLLHCQKMHWQENWEAKVLKYDWLNLLKTI